MPLPCEASARKECTTAVHGVQSLSVKFEEEAAQSEKQMDPSSHDTCELCIGVRYEDTSCERVVEVVVQQQWLTLGWCVVQGEARLMSAKCGCFGYVVRKGREPNYWLGSLN